MATKAHSLVSLAAKHPIPKWEHANAAARAGETVASTDLGAVSWQKDSDTFWVALTTAPTWAQVLAGDGSGNFALDGDLTLTGGGSILSTANGNIGILPHNSGITTVGTGSTSRGLNTNDDLFVAGRIEADQEIYADSGITVAGSGIDLTGKLLMASNEVMGSASSGQIVLVNSVQTPTTLTLALGTGSRHLLICEQSDKSTDFGHPIQVDPTTFHQSSDATELSEYSTVCWNHLGIGGGKASYRGYKSIAEEVTIAVGQGATGVNTSANLAPANSRIHQVMTRVTQAPGGGATTLDAGRTNGGNTDEYTDGTAVALGTTTIADDDGDGVTAIPHWNSSADTIVLTTDANVTGTDMKVRVVVFYEEFVVPTS